MRRPLGLVVSETVAQLEWNLPTPTVQVSSSVPELRPFVRYPLLDKARLQSILASAVYPKGTATMWRAVEATTTGVLLPSDVLYPTVCVTCR